MNGSDWLDPFEQDDEAARERARRRAEREARRRERRERAQRQLGERVRELRGGTEAAPRAEREPTKRRPVEIWLEEGEASPPRRRGPRGPRRVNPAALRRRRIAAVCVIALVLLAVFALAAALRGGGGEEQQAAPPARERKTVSITIPEGLSRKQVAKIVEDAGLRGNYVKATGRTKGYNLRRWGAAGADSLEGFLFPATYEVYARSRVERLIRQQLEAFEQNLAQVNLRAARRANLSVYDVVIIASMIEREISVPKERKLAASVIYNRLRIGMPLGIDATIRYALNNWDEPLRESELATDTPYNTRLYTGLPPGPIGNPGLASLKAAADPPKTDFLYYVVKPGTCGEHEFLETEAEFYEAVARYNRAREAAGGKSPTDC
jgi:cell division protein YceG involved in septum cleavage